MSLFELLQTYNPSVEKIVESPIVNAANIEVGWNSFVLEDDGFVVAGGTSTDRMKARRIALAEGLERAIVGRLSADKVKSVEFGFDKVPGSIGCAVGFERLPTKIRSVCEGVEFAVRDVLGRRPLNFEKTDVVLKSDLTRKFSEEFDSLQFWKLEIQNVLWNEAVGSLYFFLCLGSAANGTFAGYRVAPSGSQGWDHALIECSRNLNNYNSFCKGSLDSRSQKLAAGLNVEALLNPDYFENCISFLENTSVRPILVKEHDGLREVYFFRSCFKVF